MSTRPNLTNLLQLTSPNPGTTVIVVQDSGIPQIITSQQAIELISNAIPTGIRGLVGSQGTNGRIKSNNYRKK